MTPFRLTPTLVHQAFRHLGETSDLGFRSQFFSQYLIPDVKWTVTGSAHSLAGTRNSIKDHATATFDNCGSKLTGPIKFNVVRVLVDGEWSCVEIFGEATRKDDGKPYNNEYVWLMKWNEDGKVEEIRSYFDTAMSENLLGVDVGKKGD